MIKVFEPKLSFSDKLAVFSSIMKNEISGSSPIVKTFEENTAKEFDRKYASAVSNGSVALDLAFQSLNLSDEDEIIIPSFTIISALAAVIRNKSNFKNQNIGIVLTGGNIDLNQLPW